jgi:hypothetical protein
MPFWAASRHGETVDQAALGSLESSLLLACAKPAATAEDQAVIRQLLGDGIDWTVFARTAADSGPVGQ